MQAMEYLPPANRAALGEEVPSGQVTAEGKDVVIIGGGDTGADCLGTAIRQGARSVTQLEIMPRPPEERAGEPAVADVPDDRTASRSAHEEGGERVYAVSTTRVRRRRHGAVARAAARRGRDGRRPVPAGRGLASARSRPSSCCSRWASPGRSGPAWSSSSASSSTSAATCARDDDYMSSVPGVFVAGDAGRGQSLIVWAIAEGRAVRRRRRRLPHRRDQPAGADPADGPPV